MRKSLYSRGKSVGNLGKLCVGYLGLSPVVKNTAVFGVDKLWRFKGLFTLFVQSVFHHAKDRFISVSGAFLPAFHTTYNKRQLIKVNNLLLIAGEY